MAVFFGTKKEKSYGFMQVSRALAVIVQGSYMLWRWACKLPYAKDSQR
jgi:hypothetical protein